jgi:predicted Fe-Mo cluster-binding NifX family protein
MKIAVTSQDRKTITAHAGLCRKFWIYDVDGNQVVSRVLLELSREQSLHECHGDGPHPLDTVDVLIAGGMGSGLVGRLARRGVRALVTSESDPDRAVAAFVAGQLDTLAPQCGEGHGHHHHQHHHDHGCG